MGSACGPVVPARLEVAQVTYANYLEVLLQTRWRNIELASSKCVCVGEQDRQLGGVVGGQ